MSVISKADYVTIATKYANFRQQVRDNLDYFYDACTTVTAGTSVEQDIDLLPTLYTTYMSFWNDIRQDTKYLSACRSLNAHVFRRGTITNVSSGGTVGQPYTTITQFLKDGGSTTTVPQDWADLCAQVGETLDPTVIG